MPHVENASRVNADIESILIEISDKARKTHSDYATSTRTVSSI